MNRLREVQSLFRGKTLRTSRTSGRVRILHVVGGMNPGGVETWLLHVLRHFDRERFQMDFLVHTAEPCAYDVEIRALGSRVIRCLDPRRFWVYARNFRRALATHGPYDIVHSHVHAYSGYVLRLARHCGVPGRIAHSHSNTSCQWTWARPVRRTYLALSRYQIRRNAKVGLAASRPAAQALFGSGRLKAPLRRLLYYGCDLAAFHQAVDRRAVRREFDLNPEDLVIGHAGSFRVPKNHDYWVEIAAEAARQEPRCRFLLVGEGPLRPAIERKAGRLGLGRLFRFAGARADVPRLMLGAMDAMLFPSLWEGLPLVVIEAQAAGLPSVTSTAVPNEAVVVPSLVQRLGLANPAPTWAQAILAAACGNREITQPEALHRIEQSPFHIRASVRSLQEIYETAC